MKSNLPCKPKMSSGNKFGFGWRFEDTRNQFRKSKNHEFSFVKSKDGPAFFSFFSGVYLLENTVRLTKKSNWSIFWGADLIIWAVTAHAWMSKKILLKWLVMNNHTPSHIMKLLLHQIQPQIWPGLHGRTFFHLFIRQPLSRFWYFFCPLPESVH